LANEQLLTDAVSISHTLTGQATAVHDEQHALAYLRYALKTISP
jgi:hypothetical protein